MRVSQTIELLWKDKLNLLSNNWKRKTLTTSYQLNHIGAQVFFRLFWWDFRWFTFSFTFFGDFSSEIFGDSPFSSPFLVTFPVMNFAIHYIHHRFWWLSCHLFCHFDISLSFYLFWPFFRWPFRQPYKFITIFGASLVTFFVLIFFLPFYSPFLGDFFGDRSFYPTHLSVSLLLCLRGSVKEFKTFFFNFATFSHSSTQVFISCLFGCAPSYYVLTVILTFSYSCDVRKDWKQLQIYFVK